MSKTLTIKQYIDMWGHLRCSPFDRATPGMIKMGLAAALTGKMPATVADLAEYLPLLAEYDTAVPNTYTPVHHRLLTAADGSKWGVVNDIASWTADRFLDMESHLAGKTITEQVLPMLQAVTYQHTESKEAPGYNADEVYAPAKLASLEQLPAMEGWEVYLFFMLARHASSTLTPDSGETAAQAAAPIPHSKKRTTKGTR